MRKNLNKILAWTLAAALAFPTQAAAAMPASYGVETADSGSQDIQSENSASADDQQNEAGSAGSESSDAESGTEAGAEEEGSTADEEESGGSENSEESGSEAAGEESASGSTEDGGGSETEENTGTEDAEEDTETGSDGTENGEDEAGESESSGTNAGESEEAGTDDTADDVIGETADSETDAETGTGESEAAGAEDAEDESAADETTEGDPAAGETAADTEVVIVEPTAPEKPEETKKAEIKENETEVYTVSYEVIPEEGAEVKGKEEVKEGKDLTFKVTPEDGYKIESVSVNGEELTDDKEKKSFLFFFGDTYYEYKVQDVQEDLEIAVYLEPEALTAQDGDTEVSIKAEDKNALDNVDSVEIAELGQDEAVEAALKEQLDGQEIVDYKAIDITLYDEEGNEVEPEGDVSVAINGISTDEEYDEVAIFHLTEKVMPKRSNAPALNSISAISTFDEQPAAYAAEEVTKGVENQVEEESSISFTTDHFSTYVITFIKNAEEFTDINVNAVVYNSDGGNSNPQSLDIGDHSVTIRIEEGTINIINIISGNNLSQIEADGKTYVYAFATWGNNVDDKILDDTSINYDMIVSHKNDGIYIWYEDVSTQMVPVSVALGNAEPKEGYEITAGTVGYQKAQDAIGEIEGVWAYTGTYIKSKEPSDTKVQISSVRVVNGNYYVIPEDSAEEVPYSAEDFIVVLEFVEGRKVTVHVTGADTADTNAGNTVEGLKEGETSFVRQASSFTEIQIPITIGFGYRLTIKSGDAVTGTLIYDSAQNYYRDTNYNLTDTQIGNAENIYIVFENMAGKTTLDYTHYVEEVAEGNQGGTSQYHGATLTLYNGEGNEVLSANSSNPIVKIENNSKLEITNVDTTYVMNSFSINGYAITVPEDPYPSESAGWREEASPKTEAVTVIPEDADTPMAEITVTAKAEYSSAGVWPAYYWKKNSITYTIFFDNINTNLIITDFNMTGSRKEARLRNVDDGVTIDTVLNNNTTQNHEEALKNGLWNFPIQITLTPELGYYVTDLLLNDVNKADLFGESAWYEKKTIKEFDVSGNVNYVDIKTDKITYNFEYKTSEGGTIIGEKSFTLGVDDINTGRFDQNIELSNIPEGCTFVGWMLTESNDPLRDGYTAADSAYGMSKDAIKANGEIKYDDVTGKATIMLYPAYVPSSEAATVGYKVEIYVNDVLEDTLTQSDGLSPRPIGSYIHSDTLLNDVEVVKNAVQKYLEKGYIFDNAKSSQPLVLQANPESNVFRLYFRTGEVEVTFESGENGHLEEADGTKITGSKVTLQVPREKFVSVPTPVADEGYAFAGWTPELPEKVPAADQTYTATFGVDRNGDGTVDDKETKINIKFEAGENGSLDGRTEFSVLKDLEFTAAVTVPTPVPAEGYAFDSWTPELPEKVPAADQTYTATFGVDRNGDGTVDDKETKINIKFEAGENGSLDGQTEFSVLKDLEFTAAVTVPTPVPAEGYAFDSWTPELPATVPAADQTYTATFGVDRNGDGIVDDNQDFQSATLRPYDTSIYTGGVQEDGFPVLALRYEQANRAVEDDAITAIAINGVRYEGLKTLDLFDAVYWQDGDAAARPNDDMGGVYNAAVVLKNAAVNAVAGSSGGADGLLVGPDGHRVLASNYPVVIEASYEDGTNVIYSITINPSTLIVRYVNAEDVLRPVASNEAELQIEEGRAAAVVPEEAQLHINGNPERPLDRDSADIRLLSDEILDLSDNRQQLLVDRGFQEALGMSSEAAAEAGYESITRYFDLVDYNNGNAWITSDQPTTVYMPLPEGTDSNTEFTLLHFKELHRENYYEDVAKAIADAPVVSVSVAVEGGYIKFSTETGKDAFSPFMLIWKLDDSGTDTPDTDHDSHGGDGGSDSSGSSRPGAGPGASGSTYTAGVDGNWVHMDPDNIMIPISEDVPEGATPVTAPEWHQWKFILNNGTMLYDQWAYVKNPYAVGDQPDEGWFSFAENGIMEYGWYLDRRTGKWYWMHRTSDGMLGTMLTGWHYDDQDGKWYYMSPSTGEMLLGWQMIDGKWYFFNPDAPAVTWEFDPAAGGWTYNGSASRPYGSMYVDETTPDGYQVGADGAWIQ